MAGADVIGKAVDAFNKHDAAELAGQYAEDAVIYDPFYPEPLRGRAAAQKDMEDFFRAFPDASNAVRTTLENGSVVAAELAVKGTNKGPLALPGGEIPATGKPFTFEAGIFSRLNSRGEIVEEHRYFDMAGLLTQLGLVS